MRSAFKFNLAFKASFCIEYQEFSSILDHQLVVGDEAAEVIVVNLCCGQAWDETEVCFGHHDNAILTVHRWLMDMLLILIVIVTNSRVFLNVEHLSSTSCILGTRNSFIAFNIHWNASPSWIVFRFVLNHVESEIFPMNTARSNDEFVEGYLSKFFFVFL